MNTAELTESYLLQNYGRTPLPLSRGEGSWIWDEEGNRYLDFGCGIAVCSLGHCPSVIVDTIHKQSQKLIHCSNLYQIREQAELAQFLVEQVVARPGKVFFCNSGAEANDSLIKLARKRSFDLHGPDSGKTTIVTCKNSFHGRTLGGIAATGQEKVKEGFDPLLPGFLHTAFNDCEALREAVTENTAAILIEPIQGESGIHVATPEFLQTAADLRDQYDLLLMFDEVQSGVGRSGEWCSWRAIHPGIEPDAVSWAKGIAGGFPMGAIWIGETVERVLGPGTHGSTFGGTPLGSAVALAVLREIASQDLIHNASQQESYIKSTVSKWEAPCLNELRGKGLMLGFEADSSLLESENSEFRQSGLAASLFIVNKLRDAGLITVPAGTNVVRWLPALNVSQAEVDQALQISQTVWEALITS